METKQWGDIWEDKMRTQKNEVHIIHGKNSSIKKVNIELKKDFNGFKKWLLPLLPCGSKILDCGVGPMARHSIKFSKLGYNVTGVDISKTTLKYARKHAKEEGEDITFIKSNLIDLSEIQDSFDLVFCTQTFGHIPAYLALETLSQFASKTKKGKYCLIQFWIEKEPSVKEIMWTTAYKLAHKVKKNFVKSYHVNCSTYTREEIWDMTKRSGFTIIKNMQGFYLLQKNNLT